jgi:hypothetical protein
MNNIFDWFTKRKIVLISFILASISVFFIYLDDSNQCFWVYKKCELISYAFTIFVPIFVFSLLTCFSRIEVFNFWRRFTFFYLLFYLFISILAPFQCDAYLPLCKKNIFFILIPLYIGISLILIIYKSFKRD